MTVAIIDACALINLINSGAAPALAQLHWDLRCQGLVEDELADQAAQLEKLFQLDIVTRIAGDIPAGEVAQIVTTYRLGIGEAECIAFCLRNDWHFISDDQRARKIATVSFGAKRVTGTIGVLCDCVDHGIMSNASADAALQLARQAGGYLPVFDFERRGLVHRAKGLN